WELADEGRYLRLVEAGLRVVLRIDTACEEMRARVVRPLRFIEACAACEDHVREPEEACLLLLQARRRERKVRQLVHNVVDDEVWLDGLEKELRERRVEPEAPALESERSHCAADLAGNKIAVRPDRRSIGIR